MFKRIATVASGLALTIAGVVLPSTTASASTFVEICVSVDSTSNNGVFGYDDRGQNVWIGVGDCWSLWNDAGQARVEVPYYTAYPALELTAQKSYRIKPIGGSYGPCHSAPQSASNPPNVDRVYYKLYKKAGCAL